MTDKPAEPHACRPVDVDGETVLVRGRGDLTETEQGFVADIVRAAKRRYAAEHPEQPGRHTADTITDNDLDQLYAEIDRMKLLVAASSEPGHAVRMAAQYAERAIENGQRAEQAESKLAALKRAHVALAEQAGRDQAALTEARQWARHGYEIGQRHCGWTDHGVAPTWLTEGWPRVIDSCEHLQRYADLDMRLTHARAAAEYHLHDHEGGPDACATAVLAALAGPEEPTP